MNTSVDVSKEIAEMEEKFDDDTESIITNERYTYISSIIGECLKKDRKENKPLAGTANLCCSYVAGILCVGNNRW